MRKRLAVGVVLALVFVTAVLAARQGFVSALLPRIVKVATGYDVGLGGFRLGGGHLVLSKIKVDKSGEPLLRVDRIDVAYSLRDLLPGSRHRFGLTGVEVDRPYVTLVRHKDGSYNLSIPQMSAPPPSGPQAPNGVPIALHVVVRDAGAEVRSPDTYDPAARLLKLDRVNVDASINSASLTRYRVSGAFVRASDEPFTAVGTVDLNRGYAMHRIKAAVLPMRAIADYFINSNAADILAAKATDLDVRLYALDAQPNQPVNYHVGLTLNLTGGEIAMLGLAKPLTGVAGELKMVDDAFFFNHIHGTLAGMPVRITGGIFNFARAQYRIGIDMAGDLAALRTVFPFAKDQPMAGPVKIGVNVGGDLASPVIAANVEGHDVSYSNVPLRALHAQVGYNDGYVFLSPLSGESDGAQMSVRGTLTTGAVLHTEAAFHMNAIADRLPYAGELLGEEPLVADALIDGHDGRFHAQGALASANNLNTVAAAFNFEPNGIINVAPMWVHTDHGSMSGAYHLDRSRNISAYWMAMDGFRLRVPRHTSFLNAALSPMPPIDATIDHAAFQAGGPSGYTAPIAGTVIGHDATIASVPIYTMRAKFGGTMSDVAIGAVHATGPWGSIDGNGQLANSNFIVAGDYHGSFEGLHQFLGPMSAHGRIDGPVALMVAGNRITVQARDLALGHATLRGIPISHATGTMAFTNGILDVYNAHAAFSGGDIVVAGAYDTATNSAAQKLSIVATGLQGSGLRGIGLPLDSGTLDASGRLAAGLPLPQFDGTVAITNGRMQQFQIDGSGLVHLAQNSVELQHVVAGFDGTYAVTNGALNDLISGNPQYALHSDVAAASIANMLHAFVPNVPTFYSDGTFNGSFNITGRGLSPTVRGPVNAPAGSINGLAFTNASARIDANGDGIIAHRGAIDFQETHVAFSAAKEPTISRIHMRAPYADLSDFNNFFDTGDTLDGSGSLRFNFISQRQRLVSNGDIDVKGFRYRNLAIGDTRALWASRRNFLRAMLSVNSPSGSFRAHGSAALAPENEWLHVLRDTRYDLAMNSRNVDLFTWISALGFPQVPIAGHIDSNATIVGRFPDLRLQGDAQLRNGSIWRLPIDQFNIAFSTQGERFRIDSAHASAPGVDATASGSFGFSNTAPLDLQLHASSNDLPKLIAQLSHYQAPISGQFESTVRVGGSFAQPTFDAAFDGSNVDAYGLKMPSMFGEVRLHDHAIELRNAGVAFEKGEATLAGTLPLQIASLGLGEGAAKVPVSFDVAVNGVDPSDFAQFFGNDTKLGGSIDGQLNLSGTLAVPKIYGRFAVSNGSYVSDLERTPITDVNAIMTFNRTRATVDRLHGRLGSGTVDGSGHVEFEGGFLNAAGAGGASFEGTAVAKGAQFNFPAYGNGTVDASIKLARAKGQESMLSGKVALSNATFPFSAFLAAAQGSDSGIPSLPIALAFNLDMAATHNVRVRGGGVGAGLDIGATGAVHVSGDLQSPTLDGGFHSTGGTLTYVDRAFRVQQASVVFRPSDGVVPTLRASGITHVIDPDPDPARNPYGSADITINVDGPVTNLRVGFASNPPGYSREQILAMIAPFGGFINGIGYTSDLLPQNPAGAGSQAQLGALQPVPGATLATTTNTISVGQEAFNILNAQFTAGLFSPLESAISQGLGFQDVNLTVDYYGNVGFTARKLLGRTVNFVYSSTFGLPTRQSFGLQMQHSDATSAQLSYFFQNGPTRLFETPSSYIVTTYGRVNLAEALQGTNGFSFSLQRLYW